MYFFYWLPFFPNLANPYTERAILLLCIYTFMGYFFNFSWITRENESVIKSKSFSFKFKLFYINQNSLFSWDFMVPVRIIPPYCQKLFLRSRHLMLDVILQTDNFSQSMKSLQVYKSDLYLNGKNHFRVKMYPISQQLTKIFLIESHQENKQVKQKWDTKIQKQ